MSALDEHLKKHRKKIIDREEKTFREMLSAYAEIEKELEKSYKKLQKQIEAAQEGGETISPSWFYREKRLKKLLAQVQEQITRFGGKAIKIIEREQRAAIQIAISQSAETFIFQTSNQGKEYDFSTQISPRTIETAVGMMGDGSPLAEYFEQTLAPVVAERIKSEVIKAAAIGTDFRTIGKRLQEAGNITKYRALSSARSEVNRVRRSATLETYRNNEDILEGWEWVASKSRRTCILCISLDGRIFKLKDEFPQHVNCRCSLIPVIKNLPRRPRIIGSDWFDGQSDEIKTEILGKESFAAYQKGDVELKDFVGWKNDKRFGRSVYRKPLAKVLADKKINIGLPEALAKSIKYEKFENFKPNALHGRLWNERLAEILTGDPVAQRAYQRIRGNGAKIILEGKTIDNETFGLTEKISPTTLQVRVFLPLTDSPEETAATIVHESRHVKRWTKNRPVATQQEEILARCLEFVYNKKRRPSRAERQIIRKTVEEDYKDLPK